MSVPPSPDAGSRNRWVEQWQAGVDRDECFRRIFHQYHRLVSSFFVKKGFSSEESNDLVQETFLKVLNGLSAFRSESRFETWLFQVSANVYRNTLRSQSTRKRDAPEVSLTEVMDGPDGGGEPGLAMDAEDDPLKRLLAGEEEEVLHKALQELPSQMRRCVQLRVGQDLKYREIAAIMRVSIETVKAHLFQARQILKTKLSDYYADPEF